MKQQGGCFFRAFGVAVDGQSLIRFVEPLIGFALIAMVVLDIFFTVLYARLGVGLFSHRLACWMWWLFRQLSKPLGRHRDMALSFCGPAILAALVVIWFFTVALGSALIIHPKLGTSIVAASGPTPTDYISAIYVAGDAMTTVGTSDLVPRTAFTRLFFVLNSFMGLCMITLTLTYFLEIYNSLQRRNTLALKMHFMSDETADAAEVIAGLGPQGKFESGYAHITEMGAELTSVKESHHFYPVLFYFRFRDPHYAMTRMALVSLDMVALIKSALSDRQAGWLKESAAVAQLWRGTMRMLTVLALSFLPQGMPEPGEGPDPQARDRWRRRYLAAVRRLQQAGIQTTDDLEAGAEIYISHRMQWDRYIVAFADHMACDLKNIDPAGQCPEESDQRQAFRIKLKSAG
jgi:hypothetical protein